MSAEGLPDEVVAAIDEKLAAGWSVEEVAAWFERLAVILRAEDLGLVELVELPDGDAELVRRDPFEDLPLADGDGARA